MKPSTNKLCGKPKILHIINSLDIGGAEQQLMQFLINTSRGTCNRLHALVLFGGCYVEYLRSSGVKVINLNLKRKYSLLAPWKIMRFIKRNNYRLVVAQLSPTIFYVALASLILPSVKYISRETNIGTRRRKYRMFKILDWMMYSRYDKILCVDHIVQEKLIEWVPRVRGKTLTFNKGIVIPRLKKSIKKDIDLIFVGRIVPQKGIDVLLNAIARLQPGVLVKRAVIVGDGSHLAYLKQQTAKLNLSNTVDFVGKKTDIETLLQRSRLFVLPSIMEGTPSALLEAMACCTPVVATKVGGIPLVVDNGVDGLLVQPNNVRELSEAIETLLRRRTLAQKLATNARSKIVRDYSIDKYSDRLLALCNKLLATR